MLNVGKGGKVETRTVVDIIVADRDGELRLTASSATTNRAHDGRKRLR